MQTNVVLSILCYSRSSAVCLSTKRLTNKVTKSIRCGSNLSKRSLTEDILELVSIEQKTALEGTNVNLVGGELNSILRLDNYVAALGLCPLHSVLINKTLKLIQSILVKSLLILSALRVHNSPGLNKVHRVVMSCPPRHMKVTDHITNVVRRHVDSNTCLPRAEPTRVMTHQLALRSIDVILQIIQQTLEIVSNRTREVKVLRETSVVNSSVVNLRIEMSVSLSDSIAHGKVIDEGVFLNRPLDCKVQVIHKVNRVLVMLFGVNILPRLKPIVARVIALYSVNSLHLRVLEFEVRTQNLKVAVEVLHQELRTTSNGELLHVFRHSRTIKHCIHVVLKLLRQSNLWRVSSSLRKKPCSNSESSIDLSAVVSLNHVAKPASAHDCIHFARHICHHLDTLHFPSTIPSGQAGSNRI